jgi:hypothetical protein
MIIKGDFLEGLKDPTGLVAAPTNGVLITAGLVMGAGAALALAKRVPGLREALAQQIIQKGMRKDRFWQYGFVAVHHNARFWGAFQTKLDFREASSLELIRFSAQQLRMWMLEHPRQTVHLAFPGIGLGGLEPEQVLEILREELKPMLKRLWLYRL